MEVENRLTIILSWLQRIMVIIFLILSVKQANAQCTGDFPYFETFTTGVKPPSVSLATVQSGTNAATFTTNGLQLTPATNLQFGAVFVNNKQFTSANGIHIEFEFNEYTGSNADGICMFLFDASIATPVIGSIGAGLGYGYNRANNSWPALRQTGLTGAYLGVGLDAYGNFKGVRWQGDARTNGVNTAALSPQPSSDVTLRGAKGAVINAGIGLGDGYTGYPVLITQSTKSGTNSGAIVDPTTGNYSILGALADNFDLHTSTLGLTPASADYRKAFVDLLPNPSGGFNVTVAIQHGATVTTVISNYWYRTSYVYRENANPEFTDYNTSTTQGANTYHTLNTAPPSAFRIGFGASTGGLNQINLIKNLKVTLPYAAVATADVISTCANSNGTVLAIANDIAYTGPFTGPPVAASSNVDKTSFQFVDATGTIRSSPYTVAGVGTWSYNSATGEVTFVPALNYTGTSSVQYTIKGTDTPFNDECYRSLPVTITVTVNAKPTVTVSSNVSICNGSSTTLTAGGAVSYSWSPSTGLSAITGSSVTANPAITTVYTVTGTDANGCTNTATVTVSNTTPAQPTLSAVTQPTCSVATGSFTITNYNASYNYIFTPSAGVANTAGSVFAPAGTYTVTATLGACTSIASASVVVDAQPETPALSIAPASQTICSGATATLTASGTNLGTVSWSSNYFGITGTGTSITSGALVNKGTASWIFRVNAIADNGSCTAETNTTVTILPEPRVIAAPGSLEVCSYETLHLTLSSAFTGTTINWTIIDNSNLQTVANGSGTDNVVISNKLPLGSYSIKATGTKDGCTSGVTNVPVVVN